MGRKEAVRVMETYTWLCKGCRAAFGVCGDQLAVPVSVEPVEVAEDTSQPSSPAPKRMREEGVAGGTPCSCCLGLLDGAYQTELAENIAAQFREEKYEQPRSFQLCVHLPPQLPLLQKAVHISLNRFEESSSKSSPSSGTSIKTPSPMSFKEELRVKISALLKERLGIAPLVSSAFQIYLKLAHTQSEEKWLAFLKQNLPSLSRAMRNRLSVTHATVEQSLPTLSFDSLEAAGLLPSSSPYNDFPVAMVTFSHASLFVAGRYNKYSRKLSQTPWFVDGERRGETSVQELICNHLQSVIRPASIRFSSSGREDVDVRMLGSGRPFLVEFVDPHSSKLSWEQVRALEEEINSSTDEISVHQLVLVGKKAQLQLKEGEEDKQKHYRALVWASCELQEVDMTALSSTHKLKISQKTPVRVLHRRSMATRERTVFSMRGEMVDPHHFTLHLVTQAGTYIKEFVHGDFGRTVPNLCQLLGQEVDILTLDVMEVELEWPPLD